MCLLHYDKDKKKGEKDEMHLTLYFQKKILFWIFRFRSDVLNWSVLFILYNIANNFSENYTQVSDTFIKSAIKTTTAPSFSDNWLNFTT